MGGVSLPLGVIQGNTPEVLRSMKAESVQCVVTSIPYWGLRDYGLQPQIFDDPGGCEHTWGDEKLRQVQPISDKTGLHKDGRPTPITDKYRDTLDNMTPPASQGQFCSKCNAWRGSLGLEPTPELYLRHVVEIFREVRRVMRKDATVFLNMGDSYFSSSQREAVYDTHDKALEDSQDHGCLCENLCDVCRVVYRSHRFHSDTLLVSMLTASLSLPNLENKELVTSHSPTLDSSCQESHSASSIQGQEHPFGRVDEQLRASLESTLGESFRQFLGVCLQRAKDGECLLCARSLNDYVRVSEDKKVCICGTSLPVSSLARHKKDNDRNAGSYPNLTTASLKPKDLCGIPWRLALALQADGWWLRMDIVWSKPNPMPESVTDRPTRAHEYIFLLTKSARYYYDTEAVREAMTESTLQRISQPTFDRQKGGPKDPRHGGEGTRNRSARQALENLRDNVRRQRMPSGWNVKHDESDLKGRYKQDALGKRTYTGFNARYAENPVAGRNMRSVWNIATQPFPKAHFATFPEKLVQRCLMVGTSEWGACPECGAPWERVVEKEKSNPRPHKLHKGKIKDAVDGEHPEVGLGGGFARTGEQFEWKVRTTGWRPTCECGKEPVPCVVLDPFLGSGTVGNVAQDLGRDWIGIELNPDYCEMARQRTKHRQEVLRLA